MELSDIKKIVKENKDYIEALKELDRTGKLRKVRYKERATFTIDESLMNEFRRYCEDKDAAMSKVVERLIKKLISSS
ncbi:MAG: hypothetical protein KAU20_04470 [Nanoarchaeota archaeon]|nr:hypothetical protein [Nanoarchaeota archaeon]